MSSHILEEEINTKNEYMNIKLIDFNSKSFY